MPFVDQLQQELMPFFRKHLTLYVLIDWSHPADDSDDAWVSLAWGTSSTTIFLHNGSYQINILVLPLQNLKIDPNNGISCSLKAINSTFYMLLERKKTPVGLSYLLSSTDRVSHIKTFSWHWRQSQKLVMTT